MKGVKFSTELSDIIDVTRRSAYCSSGINIFELGTLHDLVGFEKVEELRALLSERNVSVHQLTNHPSIEAWTEHTELATKLVKVRYIDPQVFSIRNEIVIFDDVVATYRVEPSIYYVETQDEQYANMMRELFASVWKVSTVLITGIDGSAHAKQYKPISMTISGCPVVVYPAKDDGEITKAFSRDTPLSIENYVEEVVYRYQTRLNDAEMIICYVWNEGQIRMADVWKLTSHFFSKDSGFLYDCFTVKEMELCSDMGVASGNSLITFTAEELLLRELIFRKNLSFKEAADREAYQAKFPAGYKPIDQFYSMEDR